MLVRVTRASCGLADYLISGNKRGSQYSRNDKDNVIPIYGDLQVFKETEKYLNKHKNYKDNYLHITISYSKSDMQLMDNMTHNDKMIMKKDIIQTYIKHHTSGYYIDNEVIAYAETHQPIIKFEDGKERYEHEHLAVALYNPLTDTKLQTTFFNNSFIDDTLQAYINKKYGLSHPKENQRDKRTSEYDTQVVVNRKYYKEVLKDIKSSSELIQYFKDNNINYKEVKTKSNNYYKIINNNGKDINLKGKDFEHIHKVTLDKDFVYNEHKNIKELEEILTSYYEKRIKQINNRRSKTSKEAIKDIYKEQKLNDKENSINNTQTYQQKLFYKHYKHLIKTDLTGYYVQTANTNNPKFVNKSKKINIEDKGSKIVSNNKSSNLKEEVSLMLDIAQAKNWKLKTLQINGNTKFKEEVERQVVERIKLLNKEKDLLNNKQVIIKRPTSQLQQCKKDFDEKQEQIKANNNVSLQMLKQNLNANLILNFAINKYKLNRDDYTITDDNKINNINNRQKPKNIIDFLQKEVHLSTSESINICKDLNKDNRERVNSTNQSVKKAHILNKTKGKKDDKQREFNKQQRAVARRLHKCFDREFNKRRKTSNLYNLPKLPECELAHNKQTVAMLLQDNALNKLGATSTAKSDNKLRHPSVGDVETQDGSGREFLNFAAKLQAKHKHTNKLNL